jgi:hypothetical protein
MSYTIPADSPKKATALGFGRELVKAYETRGIPRSELWRATGIGRTALDNYRTGSILPRTEAAAALAAVLEWPKLLEIVQKARTKACARCGRSFRMEGGNSGRKRYCGPGCRDLAAQEQLASRRLRKGGQTDDRRQTAAAVQRLRSGIRIAEDRAAELADAIDGMCRGCEPEGVCRTADCPLRAFSPLPFQVHEQRREPKTMAAIRVELDRKAAPKRRIAMNVALSAAIFAARELAWQPHANLSDRKRYAARVELHGALVLAMTRVRVLSANASPELRFLAEAMVRVALCSFSNRRGEPYYARRQAMAELRGCLLAFDRAREAAA